jgi:hypothetical protein
MGLIFGMTDTAGNGVQTKDKPSSSTEHMWLLTGIVRQQCKVCPELELREKGQEPILSD